MEGYTAKELADIAGVGKRHIQQLCQSGKLKCHKKKSVIGSYWIIPLDEAARWLKERQS